MPGHGTLASAADVDSLHGVVSTAGCTLCHDYAGTRLDAAVVRQTIELGLNGTLVSCTNCHTAQSSNHYQDFMHSVAQGPNDLSYDAPGQLCSDCHDVANYAQIESIEHNVSTNGADACSTCHNSPRQEVIDAIALGANPTACLDCHSDKALTRHVDHVALGYVTGGATTCVSCHYLGAVNNGTVTGAHLNNCLLCHADTTDLALLPGVPVNGGDCVTCHTGSWESEHNNPVIDHTPLVKVGTTDCANCHTDTLTSAATETHNACGSCHNSDGFLIGSATGALLANGGDCTTCHGSTWNTLHPTTTTDHGGLVTVASTPLLDEPSLPPLAGLDTRALLRELEFTLDVTADVAPPILARHVAETGEIRCRAYGLKKEPHWAFQLESDDRKPANQLYAHVFFNKPLDALTAAEKATLEKMIQAAEKAAEPE